ncbi:hypothetical protein N7468_007750 [Penicillium chermesinum]|uniref:Uncharacterized protein n=1 Tax=Penicillium chermesinum TaxID=63820 RepID=A0A9W9NUW7_9EURO|nr:uncharacterized protein N7468_007750 [Penicillium chermesinum]KAJ5226525.1 hypothetical protein N7468_007750 [Penicillium chermesinum]
MPRPARHDQLPQLTRLIDWESLTSNTYARDGISVSATSDSGLPALDASSLPLPYGNPDVPWAEDPFNDALETQDYVQLLPSNTDPTQENYSAQSMRSGRNTDLPRDPIQDGNTTSRLEQCVQAILSAGFLSAESFVLEYFLSRLRPPLRAATLQQSRGSSTLGQLVMVLQSASTCMDPVEVAGLHHGIIKAAGQVCSLELQQLKCSSYHPEEVEYQVSCPIRYYYL